MAILLDPKNDWDMELGPGNSKPKTTHISHYIYGIMRDLVSLLSGHTVYSISKHRFIAQWSMQILFKGTIFHKNDD